MSEFYRISSEKFQFKVKFDTDLGGHPQTSMTPRSVITLRDRRALKCFLLLYESLQPAVNRQPGYRRGGLVEQEINVKIYSNTFLIRLTSDVHE